MVLPLTYYCGSAGRNLTLASAMVASALDLELSLAGFHPKDTSDLHRLSCFACLPNMQAPGAYNNPVAPPPPAAPKKYDGQNGVPLYDASHGGHYGASAAIATAGHAPPPETFSGHWGNVSTFLRAHTFTHHLIY